MNTSSYLVNHLEVRPIRIKGLDRAEQTEIDQADTEVHDENFRLEMADAMLLDTEYNDEEDYWYDLEEWGQID